MTEMEQFMAKNAPSLNQSSYDELIKYSNLSTAWLNIKSSTTLLHFLRSGNLDKNYQTSILMFAGNIIDFITDKCSEAKLLCAQVSYMFAIRIRDENQMDELYRNILNSHIRLKKSDLSQIDKEVHVSVPNIAMRLKNKNTATDVAHVCLGLHSRVTSVLGVNIKLGDDLREIIDNPFAS